MAHVSQHGREPCHLRHRARTGQRGYLRGEGRALSLGLLSALQAQTSWVSLLCMGCREVPRLCRERPVLSRVKALNTTMQQELLLNVARAKGRG